MNWLKALVPQNWRDYVLWFCAVATIGLLVMVGCLPTNTPLRPPPIPVFVPPNDAQMGWVSDPEAVKAVQAKLEFKVFSDTPAGQDVGDHSGVGVPLGELQQALCQASTFQEPRAGRVVRWIWDDDGD